jgi:hypothetical protein
MPTKSDRHRLYTALRSLEAQGVTWGRIRGLPGCTLSAGRRDSWWCDGRRGPTAGDDLTGAIVWYRTDDTAFDRRGAWRSPHSLCLYFYHEPGEWHDAAHQRLGEQLVAALAAHDVACTWGGDPRRAVEAFGAAAAVPAAAAEVAARALDTELSNSPTPPTPTSADS